MVRVSSIVTICVLEITTVSPTGSGTKPPVQVEPADQFPEPAEVITAEFDVPADIKSSNRIPANSFISFFIINLTVGVLMF